MSDESSRSFALECRATHVGNRAGATDRVLWCERNWARVNGAAIGPGQCRVQTAWEVRGPFESASNDPTELREQRNRPESTVRSPQFTHVVMRHAATRGRATAARERNDEVEPARCENTRTRVRATQPAGAKSSPALRSSTLVGTRRAADVGSRDGCS